MKGIQDHSVFFLTTACESTIISKVAKSHHFENPNEIMNVGNDHKGVSKPLGKRLMGNFRMNTAGADNT